MNSLRAFGAEAEPGVTDEETAIEAPPEIGSDERRMHVRAYNYWVSLLDGRAYPSIEDLEPADLDEELELEASARDRGEEGRR